MYKENNDVNIPNQVTMGPMNGPNEPHPATIRSVCEVIGHPLPKDAVCGNQPSFYLSEEITKASVESVKSLLGKFMPVLEKDELARFFKSFKRKYETQNCLKYTDTDLLVYFCDWLLYCRNRGFTHNCYFDYELYNKEADIRDTFLNEGYRIRIHKACKARGYSHYLLDKATFNKKFEKYVKRDWVDTSTCTYDEFLAFCEKHDRFFAKPVKGTGGEGARIIERDTETREKLFEICKAEELILEDIVTQHPTLAAVNKGSVNTARVITLMCPDNVPRIMFSVVRFGRPGIVVDNFHGGGMGAILDPDTGVIISNAINRAHDKLEEHPDSHVKFLGFQYPEWEKVKAAVLDAHTMLPEMRNIGWDVAVTCDGEVEFIEGNGKPNNHLPQAPDQTGRRHKYEEYLKEIEKAKGIKAKEWKPVKLIDLNAPVKQTKPNFSDRILLFVKRVKRFIKKRILKK